jgi:type IV pilus assembly protein PilO
MIKPANNSLHQTQQRIKSKKQKLSEIENIKIAAEDISKRLENLENTIKVLESRLPPSSEVHKVLKQVTTIAQRQGLDATTIRTMDKKNNSGYIEQPLKIQLKGEYLGFYSFLLEMEELPRIMRLRQLKLIKQRKKEGKVSVEMIISVFFEEDAA